MPLPTKPILFLALLLAAAPPALAQAPAEAPPAGTAPAAAAGAPSAMPDAATVYRREVFAYDRRGRPDPFRPLMSAGDLGIRLEDLRLRGVVYNPNPRLSVAVFAQADTGSSIRLRVGQRYGNLTVMAIQPRRVDVRVDEFGQSRVQSIPLRRQPFVPQNEAPPPAALPQQGVAQPQAAPPEAPQPLQSRQARQRQQAREAQQNNPQAGARPQQGAPAQARPQPQQPQPYGRPNQ